VVRSPGFSGALRDSSVLRGSPGSVLRGTPGFSRVPGFSGVLRGKFSGVLRGTPGYLYPGRGQKLGTDAENHSVAQHVVLATF
jgi:hypothetical protein